MSNPVPWVIVWGILGFLVRHLFLKVWSELDTLKASQQRIEKTLAVICDRLQVDPY